MLLLFFTFSPVYVRSVTRGELERIAVCLLSSALESAVSLLLTASQDFLQFLTCGCSVRHFSVL